PEAARRSSRVMPGTAPAKSFSRLSYEAESDAVGRPRLAGMQPGAPSGGRGLDARGERPQRDSQVVARVEEAHVGDERSKGRAVVREEALADVVPDQVAEQAPEVLVARVGQEAPRVRHHADEAGQQAETGEGADLRLHPVPLVEEPPGGAVLELSG